jgi:cellulose biosynthesis protein BcsQ
VAVAAYTQRQQTPALDRFNLQTTIAVINGKGGVGKTTLTANLGGILAASGWRVLLVDLDPQGNLGLDLGYRGTQDDDCGRELSTSLLTAGHLPVPLRGVRPNLDVLVGGQALEGAAAQLLMQAMHDTTAARLSLARALSLIASDYDIVMIDCPPASEVLQSAAVAAAKFVLIPVKQDTVSLGGLEITASRIEQVDDLNPELDLLGVILFDSGTGETRVRRHFLDEVVEILRAESERERSFPTLLRHASAAASRARREGLLVHELEQQVNNAEPWYDRVKKNLADAGTQSAIDVAGDLQAIAAELVWRLAARGI